MNLRIRVALAAIFSTGLVVLIAGVTLIQLISNNQYAALDRRLTEQTYILEKTLTPEKSRVFFSMPLPSITTGFNPPRHNRKDGFTIPTIKTIDVGIALKVISNNNGVFMETYGFPDLKKSIDSFGFFIHQGEENNWRFLRKELTTSFSQINKKTGTTVEIIKDTGLVMIVASSTNNLENTIQNITNFFFIVGILCSVLAGMIGWYLGGKALIPLYNLIKQTTKIRETSDLSFRVNAKEGPFEINELAHQMNQLLQTIEKETNIREKALLSAQDFAGNAAHELRTPLTSMITNLDILSTNPNLKEKDRIEVIEELYVQQKRLINVLDGLRILAKGELAVEAIFETIDIAEITDSIVSNEIKNNPGSKIELEILPNNYNMKGWPEGIRVMIGNLMNNALTHAKSTNKKQHIKIILNQKDLKTIIISIEDNGPGIEMNKRQSIKERFKTGTTNSPGSGLGLALVDQQAKLHGGKLEIEDSKFGGAKFILFINK
ncbi:MAG: HAMP domain-containing sensor histidine kinase [Dehalococcoidia bacterium]|jgi:two-component system sensor histidine kinase PrrB|nr:MAG: Signal transduction histidine kinase [Chloroflexota bacterium]